MKTLRVRLALARHLDDHTAGRLAAERVLAALPGGEGTPAVHLSIAHCDGRAVAAAASRETRVGVDLELARTIPLTRQRYFLSSRERRASLPAPIVCWTFKEAAWKALALDDTTPFTALELSWRGGLPVAAHLGGRTLPLAAALREPWPRYLCAIVAFPGAAA